MPAGVDDAFASIPSHHPAAYAHAGAFRAMPLPINLYPSIMPSTLQRLYDSFPVLTQLLALGRNSPAQYDVPHPRKSPAKKDPTKRPNKPYFPRHHHLNHLHYPMPAGVDDAFASIPSHHPAAYAHAGAFRAMPLPINLYPSIMPSTLQRLYDSFPVLTQLLALGRNSPAQYDACVMDLNLFVAAREAIQALNASWGMSPVHITALGIDTDVVHAALADQMGIHVPHEPAEIEDLHTQAMVDHFRCDAESINGAKITELPDDEIIYKDPTCRDDDPDVTVISDEHPDDATHASRSTAANSQSSLPPPPPLSQRATAMKKRIVDGIRKRMASPGSNYVLYLSDSESDGENSTAPPIKRGASTTDVNKSLSKPGTSKTLEETEREVQLMRQRIKALEEAAARSRKVVKSVISPKARSKQWKNGTSDEAGGSSDSGKEKWPVKTDSRTASTESVIASTSNNIYVADQKSVAACPNDDAVETGSTTPTALTVHDVSIPEVARSTDSEEPMSIHSRAPTDSSDKLAIIERTNSEMDEIDLLVADLIAKAKESTLFKSLNSEKSPADPIKSIPNVRKPSTSAPIIPASIPANTSSSTAYVQLLRKRLEAELSLAQEELVVVAKQMNEFANSFKNTKADLERNTTLITEWQGQLGKLECRRQELKAEMEKVMKDEESTRSKLSEALNIRERLNKHLASLRLSDETLLKKRQAITVSLNNTRLQLNDVAKLSSSTPLQPPSQSVNENDKMKRPAPSDCSNSGPKSKRQKPDSTLKAEEKSRFEKLLSDMLIDTIKPLYVLSGHLSLSEICTPSLVWKIMSQPSMDVDRVPSSSSLIRHASRIHSTVAKTTAGAPIQLPPRLPIFNLGLRKLVDKEALGTGRYFDTPMLENDYKVRLTTNPANVALWLEYAAAMLPNDLNIETLDGSSLKITRALNVLTKALEVKSNQSSEPLWNLYLELLARKGAEKEFKTMCQKAVQSVGPKSARIYWRWYMFAKDKVDCEIILKQMLRDFGDKWFAQLDADDRSQVILDVVIQRAQNCIQACRDADAAAWMHRFLTETNTESILTYNIDFESLNSHLPLNPPANASSTVASRWLTSRDQSLCWLLFVHLVYFGRLPPSIFHPYPYDFVVRKDLYFVIQWSARSPRPDKTALSLVENTLRVVVKEWRTDVHKCRHPDADRLVDELTGGKEITVPEIAELASIMLTPEEGDDSFSEVASLLEQVARDTPSSALFSRLACLYLEKGCILEAIQTLINGAAVYVESASRNSYYVEDPFESFNDVQEPAKMALAVYCALLEISTSSSSLDINIRPDIAGFVCNADLFIWFNYLVLSTLIATAGGLDLDEETSVPNVSLLQNALAHVAGPSERSIVWIELLHEARTQQDSTKTVTSVLSRALPDTPSSLSKHVYGAGTEGDSDLAMSVPLATPELRRSIMKAGLACLPADKRMNALSAIDEAMPDIAKSISFAKILYDAGDLQAARSILHLCLQDAPRTERLWRLVLAFEYMSANDATIKNLLKMARQYLHPESATWKELQTWKVGETIQASR
ncbi:hypothetical protein SeMB42_g01257 [Synchytrium endobioticum]|uniref:Uncharacterized protein n=1 Tax=Synchytrium endobioticum TaxID=286115 RepID=A0A507DLW9_9FUNG|nr:hypothetical protein SeMB42_g01257 [Synchytrium endobioticum]